MRKKAWLIVLALLLVLVAYVVYSDYADDHKRKQNFSLTKGYVLNVSAEVMNGSHAADITYKIQVNGKDITRTTRVTCEKSNWLFMLMNKQMDVVYENDDPANSELLLTRKSYRQYKLLPSANVLHILESLEITCGAIE